MKLKTSRLTGLLATTGATLVLCASCSSAADPATSPGAAATSGNQATTSDSTASSVIGSRDVTLADPAVPRPDTKPCVVELIPRQEFGEKGTDSRMDAKPHRFKYQPPADCKGPWAKVVLEAKFHVDAGRQYDRTAQIWLNGVNLYFGTTQEPSPGRGDLPTVAPSWEVQRDLTDYSALLSKAGSGKVWINNWLDETRGAMLYASAKLLFYPADKTHPAPAVPDAIIAVNSPDTAPANLQKPDDKLSASVTFPRNTTRVYMDLIAQPQHSDEFYYFCLGDKIIQQLDAASPKKFRACGNGSYREAVVRIDGKRAGLAPISPWVFTGGIDHFMWRPTPSVQALNFMPYRVDLSPFAGVLSDGAKHTVSVQVLNAHDYFSLAASLLVYQDPSAEHTGGGMVKNTLQDASLKPVVNSSLSWNGDRVQGDVTTRARQHYVIQGFVNTSAGRVDNTVEARITFANTQQYGSGDSPARNIKLSAGADNVSTSTGAAQRELRKKLSYALRIHTLGHPRKDGQRDRSTQTRATFATDIFQDQGKLPFYESHMRNTIAVADRVTYDPEQRSATVKFHDQSSAQHYSFTDSLGSCHTAGVQAREGQVTHVSNGLGCNKPGGVKWFVHPDGSPDSFGWREAKNG
ncbi:MAG TPA: peptide-N4-asparagine amidase [Oleiagrimonas sp.]|nr:peptide-N4-asparagine amidase [Oleiagrimonas sp.]